MTTPTRRRRHRSIAVASALVAVAVAVGASNAPAQAADNPTLDVTYTADGSTHIGAQVDSDMKLGPTDITVTMDLVTTEIIDGTMTIPSKTVSFDVFGIPTRAKVTMTQRGKLTGQLTTTDQRGKLKLASQVAYDIRLSDVEAKVFGIWWPLGVGSNCHTEQPVQIDAATPEGEYFTITGGGRISDTYTIGSFTGCTPLNYFDIPGFFPTFGSIPVNTLVPGSDNTLDISLSDPRSGS